MLKNAKSKLLKTTCMLSVLTTLTFAGSALVDAKSPVKTPPTAAAPQVALPDFADLSEHLLPTVVNISTVQAREDARMPEMPEMPELPPGSPFEDFFKDFMDKQQNSPAPQAPRASALGSGFIIDAEKGYILTNNHVIKNAEEIKVILHDDTSLDATLIGTDTKTDLAVLQVKTDKKLTATKWGRSNDIRVGSWVLAIGNPFGLGGTVTAGIVSARQRDINAGPYDDFIQTDASINRGNSGGPMFNTKGEVIGVNTAIFSPTGGSVGIGFAVPSQLAEPVINQLIKYGHTKRGWLGVRIQVVTDEIAESLGMKKAIGALVASVNADGPSKMGGIKPGDVITHFDGKVIQQMRNLPRIVAETDVGKKVPVNIWRKGKEKTLYVVLGELEKAEETGLLKTENTKAKEPKKGTMVDELGLSLVGITKEAREQYNLSDDTKGMLITDVKTDSTAADKGIRAGDIIVEFDQEAISTVAEIKKRTAKASKDGRSSILLFLARNNEMRYVAIKLSKNKD